MDKWHTRTYIHNASAAECRITDRTIHLTPSPPTLAIVKTILYLMLIIELVSLNKD